MKMKSSIVTFVPVLLLLVSLVLFPDAVQADEDDLHLLPQCNGQECDLKDGWYDNGETRLVNCSENECLLCEQSKQDYRDYWYSSEVTCNPRTIGYWKQPCIGHFNHESKESMIQYLDLVHNKTNLFDDILTFDQMCGILNPSEPASMLQRAKQQTMALWLNVGSGKIFLETSINIQPVSTSTTVSSALDEAESVINRDSEKAKNIADLINNGGTAIISCTGQASGCQYNLTAIRWVNTGKNDSSNCPVNPAEIIADKIVCDNEEDLPNWGNGGPDINYATRATFLEAHSGCRPENNWYFQWAYSSIPNPGDNTGEAGAGWHTFGPTVDGRTNVSIYNLNGTSQIWVREVFKEGYINFTYHENHSNENNVSAEMYCHTDVLNYDNRDYVRNPAHNKTYYCIAFNVRKTFCGDSTIQPPEECDDGANGNDADGCTDTCRLTYCGDGIIQYPNGYEVYELCDNRLDNGVPCVPSYGGSCTYCTGSCENNTIYGPYCGDGIKQDSFEECDGNDGVSEHYLCQNNCTLEYMPYCGDGIHDAGEECDDGNNTDGDGCSANCVTEKCKDTEIPETVKTYSLPFYENGISEWINKFTRITLNTTDGSNCSNTTTFYRVTLVNNSNCMNQTECQELSGEGEWNIYSVPFSIREESCHLIEFYANDSSGNTEAIKKQCPFVDNTVPIPNKTVGEPKSLWNGIDATYYNISDRCWNGKNDSIDCWKVTTMTPITLDCEDQQPHPVNHNNVWFKVGFDGDDITETYCTNLNGSFNPDRGYCLLTGRQAPVTFYFGEESEHNLKYYCEDALGNTGPVDDEKFKVEGTAFNITLNKKWNLISVPFVMLDGSIDDAFKDVASTVESVWTYDGETGNWYVYTPGPAPDTLTEMKPGWGYWVRSYEPSVLTIGGSLFSPAMTPPDRNVVAGWNLIGYYGTEGLLKYNGPVGAGKTVTCTLNSLVSSIAGYPLYNAIITYWEPDNPYLWKYLNYENRMDPGAGYWLEMNNADIYAYATICYQVSR